MPATLTPIECLIMTKVSKVGIPQAAQYASTMSELNQIEFLQRSRELTTIGGGVNVDMIVKSIKLDVDDRKLCEIVERTLGKSKILQSEITACVWKDETLKPWIQTSTITGILKCGAWRDEVGEHCLHQAAFKPTVTYDGKITTQEVFLLFNIHKTSLFTIAEEDLQFGGIRFVEKMIMPGAKMQYNINIRFRRMIKNNSFSWHDLTITMPDKTSWLIIQDKVNMKWDVKMIKKIVCTSVGSDTEFVYELKEYHLPSVPTSSPERLTVLAPVKEHSVAETPPTVNKKRKLTFAEDPPTKMSKIDLYCDERLEKVPQLSQDTNSDIANESAANDHDGSDVIMTFEDDDWDGNVGALSDDLFANSIWNEIEEIDQENANGNVESNIDFHIENFLI